MAWYRRLLNIVRPEKLSSDLDREMAFHIHERTDDLRALGLDAAAAAHEARRMFGNPTRKKEEARDVDVLIWLDSLARDVRYALRALAASPAFTLVAVLSLALGIGANTAIFSLTDALVLKSLPVQHPEQLLEVNMGEGEDALTNPLWEQIRDHVAAFSGVFAYSDAQFNLAPGGEVRMANGAWVSGDFFNVLGVRPEAGRVLQHADDVPGCAGVAAVSDAFARREFGSALAAPGRTITLADHPIAVVGVADPAFFGVQVGRTVDVYVPLCAQSLLIRPGILDVRARWFLNVIGRPKDGLSPAQVHAALATAAPAIFRATVPANFGSDGQAQYLKRTFDVAPAATGLSDLRSNYSRALYVLMVVVGVVLLIACANIANLLLARGASRAHEISIRMALGAGRWRLVRQLLTESLLLSLMGAGLGVLFARWASGLLVRLLSTRQNFVWLDLAIDGRVLAFTALIAGGTAVLFGLLPAWRATRVDPQAAMKAGGRGVIGSDARHRIGKSLVVVQVALSLALVAAAGLLVGSFRKLTQVDPGFQQDGVLLVSAGFAQARQNGEQQLIAQGQLLDRLREAPGVRAASASFVTPISGSGWNDLVIVDGFKSTGRKDAAVWFNQVTDGYFHTMETPLLAGRDLAPTDGPAAPLVAVIDETMAHKFFGAANAVGRTFRTSLGDSASAPITIVGVVRTAKYASLKEKSPGTVYLPFTQGDGKRPIASYEVRTEGSPAALIPVIKAAATQISPGITLDFRTLSDQVSSSLSRPRLLATLSGFFGALALLLATIGLYGTMSYDVARRRNEIGIRIALGAARHRVLAMVIAEAGRLIVLGVAIGLLLALATTRFVSAFVFGLTPTDPATLTLASAVLGVVALAAALLPAWRAARVDPMNALREE
ncbi:MAG: ADOP family duplicated permease [Gemmatimonadales bacterium]